MGRSCSTPGRQEAGGSGDPSLPCRGGVEGGQRKGLEARRQKFRSPVRVKLLAVALGVAGVGGLRGSGGWETKQTDQQAGKQKQEDAGKALLNLPRTMTGASGQRKGGMRRGPHLSGKWPKWPEGKPMTAVRKGRGCCGPKPPF